jgi:hypothetical protein
VRKICSGAIRRALFSLLAAAALAACDDTTTGPASETNLGSISESSSVPFAPTADPDPFYAQPSPLPDVAHGTIVKSRKVTFSPAGVPQANPAWQLQYMTRDVNGRPLAAVASVVQPLIPSVTGSKPLVSYQFAYDSLGSKCVPSRTVTGDLSNLNSTGETLAYLPALATQGWTMVFPDYEGPYSAYGAGKLSGHATLDGIRAALGFEPLALSADTPVGMWGYSGGALATAWAASLHPSYAPELNVVGVASGGTPADVFGIVKAAEGGPFFGLIFSAVVGTARAYPELIPDSLLNDRGRRVIEAIKDGCVGATTDGSAGPSGRLADYTTASDPYDTPGARSVRPQVTLPQPGSNPTANIYVYHETLDELIPIAGTDAMVDAWCAAGTPVSYFRSVTGEHVAGVAAGAPFALAYLISRINGAPVNAVPPTARICNQ